MTIAASGERKTSADNEALAGVRQLERELRIAFDGQLLDHKNAKDAVRGDALKANKGDRLGALEALNALGPEPRAPTKPFIIVTEPTIEGLVKLLPDSQRNHRPLLVRGRVIHWRSRDE